MLTADGEVVDDEVVVGPAAECGALLGDGHLLQYNSVNCYDHFWHGLILIVQSADAYPLSRCIGCALFHLRDDQHQVNTL